MIPLIVVNGIGGQGVQCSLYVNMFMVKATLYDWTKDVFQAIIVFGFLCSLGAHKSIVSSSCYFILKHLKVKILSYFIYIVV